MPNTQQEAKYKTSFFTNWKMSIYTLVGHGAREYSFAERIREEGHKVVSVANKPNDSLAALCDHSIRVTRLRADLSLLSLILTLL